MGTRTELELAGHGGDAIRAELVRPEAAAEGGRPAVVVVHEVFGLDAFARSVAQRLADEGYIAIAPDLYSREGLPGPASSAEDPAPEWPRELILAAVGALPDRRVVADLESAVGLLCDDPDVDADRVAVLGFCMGGNYAYLLGCHSKRVSAVVDFYGRIVYDELSENKPIQPLEMALNLTAPLLGFFGSEDASIPSDHVAALEERLSAFAKPFEIRRVAGCGHGFFNHLRASFSERAAQDAWTRTLEFLDEYLA